MVRTRMYRSFGAMWQGWTKNLYPLIGASVRELFLELREARRFAAALAILLLLVQPAGSVLLPAPGLVLLAGTFCLRRATPPESLPAGSTSNIIARADAFIPRRCLSRVEEHARRGGLEGTRRIRRAHVMIRITRKIEFSAAHYYHNPNFSPRRTGGFSASAIIRTATDIITCSK